MGAEFKRATDSGDLHSTGSSASRTPADTVMIHGEAFSASEILDVLRPFVSAERLARIREVVRSRTRTIATVVEGASNAGNVSAVMRSAEGLGFCEFHVIESGEMYKPSRRSSQGAEKWIDTTVWDSPDSCLSSLSSDGYRIITTSPRVDATPLEEVDFRRKSAIVFGNELQGVSGSTIDRSDLVVRISLNGFVESYNVSVAAAICLYHVYQDRLSRQGFHGDLSEAEQEALVAAYCVRAVQHGEKILLESLRRGGRSQRSRRTI